MNTPLLTALVAMAACASPAYSQLVIDFDTGANWSAGSGALSGYQSDHSYAEADWVFTGGPALRNGTALQDGFAGAIGTYSWRMESASDVSWTATFGGTASITEIAFDVRRWDADPAPAFDVSYSVNGGASFTSVGTINNTFLDNSSAWKAFSFAVVGANPTSGLGTDDIVVRIESLGTTERIMIDNFAAVPEPSTYAALLGLISMGVVVWRRRTRRLVAA